MANMITPENQPEFIGQIIDIFEDFLTKKGVTLNNPEIQEAIDEGEDPKDLAIISGSDYSSLQDSLTAMLKEWHVLH